MTLSDLVFILSFLTLVFGLGRIVYLLVRGRRGPAGRTAKRISIIVGLYAMVLLVTSLTSPGRNIAMGEAWCFDDWCLTVDSVAAPATIGSRRPAGRWVVVSMTVSSRMRRESQAEPDAYVFLVDVQGSRRSVSDDGERALDLIAPARHRIGDRLEPGGSFHVSAAFDEAERMGPFALSKARRSRFPGIIIIGNSESILHEPATVALPPVVTGTPLVALP